MGESTSGAFTRQEFDLSLVHKTDFFWQYEAAEEIHAGWILPFGEMMQRMVGPVLSTS